MENQDQISNPDSQVQTSSTSSMDMRPQSGSHPRMGGFLPRLGALIIDAIILAVPGWILSLPVSLSLSLSSSQDVSNQVMSNALSNSWSWIVSLGLAFVYYGFFYTKYGQTPGKMVFKLKVVRANDLSLVGWGRAFVRDVLGKWISGIIILLGYFWYFMSEKRQTWHDLIADTYVVAVDDQKQVIMDGPSSYPQEPVKAFGFCGCALLLLVGIPMLIGMILAVSLGALVNSGENIQLDGVDIESQMEGNEMNFQFQDEEGNQFKMNIDPETGEFMMEGDDFNVEGSTNVN